MNFAELYYIEMVALYGSSFSWRICLPLSESWGGKGWWRTSYI